MQVALDRKKRSTLKADARAKEREIERHMQQQIALAKEMSRRKGTDKGDNDADDKKHTKKRKALVPEDDGGPRGWASSTGYCTIDGRERNKTH